MLITQMNAMANAMEQSKLQDFQTTSTMNSNQNNDCQTLMQNHNQLPVSPRFKRSILQQSQLQSQQHLSANGTTACGHNNQVSQGPTSIRLKGKSRVKSSVMISARYGDFIKESSPMARDNVFTPPHQASFLASQKRVAQKSGGFLIQNTRQLQHQSFKGQEGSVIVSQEGSKMQSKYEPINRTGMSQTPFILSRTIDIRI